MILGIIAAAQPLTEAIPDIDYVTSAIHFGGASYLARGAALTGWGTPSKFTSVVWTKLTDAPDGIFSDANDFTQGATVDGANQYINFNVAGTYWDSWAKGQLISTPWQCFMASGDFTDVYAVLRLYLGDTDVLESDDTDYGGAATISAGSNFWFGQDGYGVKITGDVADFRLWLGSAVDFSIVNNRRLFIRSNGKPADPSLATAALGTPIVSFIADPEATDPISTFVTNGGSGGDFTLTGSLTAASTSPTD